MMIIEPSASFELKLLTILVGIGFLTFFYYGTRHRRDMFARWFWER